MKYLLFSCFILIVCSSYSSAQRIAYVDQNLALKDAAEMKKAEAELKRIVQSWRDTLTLLQKNFDAKYAAFQKDSASLAPDARKNRTSELVNMQLQGKQYERLKLNNQNGGDFIATRNRLLEPVVKQFREAVAAVAKSEKIDIVLTKDKIVETADALDLTAKVAAKMK